MEGSSSMKAHSGDCGYMGKGNLMHKYHMAPNGTMNNGGYMMQPNYNYTYKVGKGGGFMSQCPYFVVGRLSRTSSSPSVFVVFFTFVVWSSSSHRLVGHWYLDTLCLPSTSVS